MKRAFGLVILFFVCACSSGQNAKMYDAAFQQYFAIGAALANDSLKDATAAAEKLQSSLPAGEKTLKIADQLKKVASQAKSVQSSENLADARKAFSGLSESMISLRKDTGYSAHQFYCPMVQKSWLQSDKDVRNPYGGKAMMACGTEKG